MSCEKTNVSSLKPFLTSVCPTNQSICILLILKKVVICAEEIEEPNEF